MREIEVFTFIIIIKQSIAYTVKLRHNVLWDITDRVTYGHPCAQ